MERSDAHPSCEALCREIEDLKNRLREADDTLEAIRTGEVDALLVQGPAGDQVFTLKGAEYGYRVLVETMNEGSVMLQLDGTVHYANSRFADFVGLPLEKIIGSKFLGYLRRDQAPLFEELLRTSSPGRAEFNLVSTSGRDLPVIISMSAGWNEEIPDAVCLIVADLSAQKQVQHDLEETTEQLNNFCYSIAHDLRAPLRTQNSYAKILLEDYGPALGETGQGFANRIIVAADKLDRLVQDLLTHTSLSRGDLPLSEVELETAITQVRADFSEQIQIAHARVIVEKVAGKVMAHEPSLTLIIGNLFSNALKYANSKDTLLIRVWTEQLSEGMVRLNIQDNGIGIEKEHHERIFGVFQRLHTEDAYPGTGIGLALVRKGIERMGGKVGVDSAPGTGSRFWLDLPLAHRNS